MRDDLRHAEVGERALGRRAWYSAGKSSAPTPTITPCPGISRGTDCTVPIVPGLVSVTVAPGEVVGVELVVRTLRIRSS